MFGYIAINKAEMKFKDYDMYHSYYCGLCKCLKECYGIRGQMTLSFDMTFLIVLLTGLYEPKTQREVVNCIAHPFEKHVRGPIILPITPLPSTLSLLIINARMIGTTSAAGRGIWRQEC